MATVHCIVLQKVGKEAKESRYCNFLNPIQTYATNDTINTEKGARRVQVLKQTKFFT